MPSDLLEVNADERDLLLARRMAGEAPIHWQPLSPRAIRRSLPGAETPFVVVVVSPGDEVAPYIEWKNACKAPPLIVAENGGDIQFGDFTITAMYAHFIEVCDKLKLDWGEEVAEVFQNILKNPTRFPARELDYKVGGHNAFAPNLMALSVAGFDDMVEGRFDRQHEGSRGYIEGIVQTTNSVFDERERIGPRDLHRTFPIKPDLMLFAPSMYSHLREVPVLGNGKDNDIKIIDRGLQILLGQRGYAFETVPEKMVAAGIIIDGGKITPNPLIGLRQKELFLNTEIVGLMAASELSAVVRLPNEINRTAGQVRQFAAQHRSEDDRDRKRLKAFRDVQDRIKEAVPKEFMALIKRSKTGIRIVSDAPLEWLDIDGVPLNLARETSRIPTTPGNAFVSQILPQPIYRLRPDAFREILIVNAVKRTDPVYPFFVKSMETFNGALQGKVSLKQVDVSSRKEFVEALNGFDGAFMIFNGHGEHEKNGAGKLWLQDEPVDVWSLRDEVPRCPPIVLLSACDTHAADRNHATTASGFLTLGAITVLGSFFPLPAMAAAIFAGRLIMRVIEFIPAVIHDFGRVVSWSEVASGMLKMTLLTDFLHRLQAAKLLTLDQYIAVHMDGNGFINIHTDNAPFEKVIRALVALGLPENQVRSEFRTAIACSSAISYVQLGRPETIIFDTEERLTKQGMELHEAYLAKDAAAAN